MRTYIIGNDGIALCRETPAAVNDGEMVVSSKEKLLARFSQTDWVFEEENRRLHAEVVAMADCNRGESWRTQ